MLVHLVILIQTQDCATQQNKTYCQYQLAKRQKQHATASLVGTGAAGDKPVVAASNGTADSAVIVEPDNPSSATAAPTGFPTGVVTAATAAVATTWAAAGNNDPQPAAVS